MEKITLEISWNDVKSLAHTIHPPQPKNEFLSIWFDINDKFEMFAAEKYLIANDIEYEELEYEDDEEINIGFEIKDKDLNELEYIKGD
jgi:hypothetical protein